MQRGTITILIIVGVALLAATASVVYHYANQRHAQDFWGGPTAALIDKAPHVELLTLQPAEPGLSLDADSDADDEPAEAEQPAAQTSAEGQPAAESQPAADAPAEPAEEAPTVKALEFNGLAWIVSKTKDGTQARGINNLRRVLVLDTTFNWSELPSTEDPTWQYGLAVNDGQNWATVLFDFKARLVGLAGGRRTAVLNPEASDAFEQFFTEEFGQP
jgi:hypothetical protein